MAVLHVKAGRKGFSVSKVMKKSTKRITLSKGGKDERKVRVSKIVIPDLWHIAMAQRDAEVKNAILECWHLAHDLKNALL